MENIEEPSESFLVATAYDYDIDIETVEKIYRQDPDNVYQNLEKCLIQRRNANKR